MSANKTAYSYYINPNGVGDTNGSDATASTSSTSFLEQDNVHETSPAWVLTFLRWSIRDTLRTDPTNGKDSKTIAPPLVIENDCIQVGVSDSKSVLTASMEATLLNTDVNYQTIIAPGDFVFVNILNWEHDSRRVANQARNLQPINGVNDGFKGFFKIQSVFKVLITDPESGIKTYATKLTGFAFTEFNNSIYFNPFLLASTDQNIKLYISQIANDWANMQTDKGLTKIQTLIQYLINSLIGSGFTDSGRKVNDISPISPNTLFYMPSGVGDLLGLDSVEAAKDVYNYLFGIQTYSSSQNQTLASGMNPSNIQSPNPQNATQNSRFILLQNPIEGNTVAKPEYWNQTKVWSILNQFTNAPLNELYTCFRIAPNGSVMPTVVLRQIPFTNDNFDEGDYNVTRFMNVPRWNISPALALNFNLGRDETARINFVQYYGRSVTGPAGFDIAEETAKQNYVYDLDDVQRNGLKPQVISTEFDRIPDPPFTPNGFRAPGWAKILGDALIGGHLKMSGTINFVGIPEPIAVGDNLQFDGVVYHIEQISHTAVQDPKGNKSFRTTILVSYGLDLSSNGNVMYSEMLYGSAYDKRDADYKDSQILPGVSESQDTYYRNPVPSTPNPNVDTPLSGSESFTQPNTNTAIDKATRDT